MPNTTLLDLITLQSNDVLTGLVEDVTTLAPEFDVLAIETRSGTFYEIVRRVGLPNASFRNLNAGVTPSKSTYKKEVKEMFFLDSPINMDEAVEDADDKSTGDAWMHEANGARRAALIVIGAQFYYGTSADAAGFQGLRAQCAGSIGAGGTTNSTSAYLIWKDPKWGCRFDIGRNGSISMKPPMRQQIADPASSSKSFFAWVSNLSLFIGLNVISDKSVWAVTGITTHQTSNVYDQNLTDSIAAKLISNIPVARRSNLHWMINRTSAFLLQASRSTVNIAGGYSFQAAGAGGLPAWSPKPDMLEGYPITLTDSIVNTESN